MSEEQAAVAAIPATLEEHHRVEQWLYYEAEMLDDNRLHDWLAQLDEGIRYRLPVRVTRERHLGTGISTQSFHFDENYSALRSRIERLDTDYAWAENPSSRVRRMISNVRVTRTVDGTFHVKSNIYVYRSRFDLVSYSLLVGERTDELIEVGGELRLRNRQIILDHTTLPTANLAIFF